MPEPSTSSDLTYRPEAIKFWLSGRCPNCRWTMLESAVEGGTGATGMGSGRGDRFGLAHLKADLERAADSLPVHWQSTGLIFSRQHRWSVLVDRRRANRIPDDQRESEHPVPSQALEHALWRMARALGWRDERQAA